MYRESAMSTTTNLTGAWKWLRSFIAGILGTLLGGGVSYFLLELVGPATVYNEALQSPKLTAVWGEIEPLPKLISDPVPFFIAILILGGIHGLVFTAIVKGLPTPIIKRGLVYGLIVWALGHLLFEINGPWMLLGEPLPLVGVELAVQLVGALLEGIIISTIVGRNP